MKIVISGGEELGYLLAQQYSSENDVHVIETDPTLIADLEKLDLKVVKGNPTSLNTLQAAAVADADFFIACAHSDEVNVISCLAVKQISKAKTFCFVNKIHYFETFAGDLGEQLVIDSLIWPEKLLGEYIAQIIAVPDAIDVKLFDQENLKLLEYRFKSGDPHIGKSLKDLQLPKGTLVVAIFRDNRVIVPGGSTSFCENDKIIFMGLSDSVRKLENRFSLNKKSQTNVVIVGGGNVGYILASALSQTGNIKIRLLENSHERCMFLADNLPESVLLMNADGTDVSMLKAQQVQSCDCFVALAGSDERNLSVALRARQLGCKRVITRAHSIDNIDFFESLGIDLSLSSQLNAIQTVHRSVSEDGIDIFAFFEKGKAEIREFVVPADFPPTQLMQLRLPEGVIIAAIRRGGRTIVPHGTDKLKGKDKLRVFCSADQDEAFTAYLDNLTRDHLAEQEEDGQ